MTPITTKPMTLVMVALLWTAAAEQTLAITYTTLDYPGSLSTFANGIDGNNIVGAYRDSLGIFHGFLYNGATYTALDHPLATNGTVARGISGGKIVGFYNNSSGGHGFLYNGTTYTTLDFPGGSQTGAYGIDGNNIVGFYTASSVGHGFLYDGTTYTTLDDPLVTGVTNAYGIDGNNIVGAYTTDSSGSSGFHGFLATVPEPSSGVLAIVAGGAMWWWRKRFK